MNEKWVTEKQEVIRTSCALICRGNRYTDDLAQYVSMYFLENELPPTVTDGFIHVVAYKAYHLSGSEFRRLHIDNNLEDSEDIEVCASIILDSASIDREYNDALNELNPVERCWAEEIVKRNMSINLLSEHTGIHRDSAKKRMNSIYKQLREKNK
jgi:hypothetical protein